jgi:hypothetical protein
MANMSAQIVREIVANSLKIKATDVILSGELPAKFNVRSYSSGGNLYSDCVESKVWAFDPNDGLIQIASETEHQAAQNANGTWNDGSQIYYGLIAEQAPNALFYVVMEHREYSDCNGRNENSTKYTLYKAPNFKSYWAAIETKDLARWEQWLNK